MAQARAKRRGGHHQALHFDQYIASIAGAELRAPVCRLTSREVCELARFSAATLWRRIRDGSMPPPIDHARQALFDRAAVERALLRGGKPTAPPPRWTADPEAIRAAHQRLRTHQPRAAPRRRGG